MQLIITLTGINNTSVCYFRSNTTKLVRPIKFRHFSHTHTISDLTLDSYYLLAYQFLRSLPSYHLFLGPTSTLRTLPLTALCTYIHPYPLLAISPGSYYSFHHSDPLNSLLSPSTPSPWAVLSIQPASFVNPIQLLYIHLLTTRIRNSHPRSPPTHQTLSVLRPAVSRENSNCRV